jgi:hypothetical protein
MFHRWQLSLLTASMVLLAADGQPWKDKKVPEWTEDDARQVLTDSPWVKSVTPVMGRQTNDNGQRRQGGGMGRGGGVGMGGIGVGLPGMGGMGGPRQRGGMGGPDNGSGYPNGGGGYPNGGNYPQDGRSDRGYNEPPSLKVRWESALPVREAELKARETNAPTVDESHYAIAVYGVPNRMADAGSRNLADQLKKQAALKRTGKKDVKPSSVQVLQREDGMLLVFLFPRSNEITKEDRRIEFDAQIGRMQLTQSFYVEDMTFQGKLEI